MGPFGMDPFAKTSAAFASSALGSKLGLVLG